MIVKVFTVNYEKNLVDIRNTRSKTRRLKRGQSLARTRGVPYITAALNTTKLLIVVCNFNAIENTLGSRNLIRTHYHQHIFRRKDTILCKYIQDGMLCKESLCKVDKVGDNAIVCICPKRSKLKAIACLFLLGFACRCRILNSIKACCIRVVFCVRAVGDYENLYVFVKSRACPKAIPLIAVDLIERFTDRNTATFEFNMYERQTVDKHGHVIAVVVLCTLCRANHVLIQHLQLVVVNIILVNQADILGSTVITAKHLHVILLYLARFLRDSFVRISKSFSEKAFPFTVCKGISVDFFELSAEVGNQLRFGMNMQILISLLGK